MSVRIAVALLAAGLVLSGCAASRVLYSEGEQATAAIPDIAGARFWSDDHESIGTIVAAGLAQRPPGHFTLLALSGGGANGAYGAGFLTGWTQTGTRPEFTVVTGVSVGALIAPFAFIGPERDPELAAMFTGEEAKGLMEFSGFDALFGSSAFSTAPLGRLVAKHVDKDLIDGVAAEYRKGRLLLVATTDVDSQRTAIWNMGAIAESNAPGASDLFRTVLLASAAVPGVFDPQPIRVAAGGRTFSELHVDGGVTSNLILVPEALLAEQVDVPLGRDPLFFAIVNGKLAPEFRVTTPGLVSVVERAFETTLKTNTANQLLATRDYIEKRRGRLFIAAIDPSFPLGDLLDFSPEKTAPLFAAGAIAGRKGERWLADPFGR